MKSDYDHEWAERLKKKYGIAKPFAEEDDEGADERPSN
jgi:t-SNARE complex subunit (syntaxin)